jgi:hypothetical protein
VEASAHPGSELYVKQPTYLGLSIPPQTTIPEPMKILTHFNPYQKKTAENLLLTSTEGFTMEIGSKLFENSSKMATTIQLKNTPTKLKNSLILLPKFSQNHRLLYPYKPLGKASHSN